MKISYYSSHSYFSCRRLGNVPHTAAVNHSRCCVIASYPSPRNIKIKKKEDDYVTAAMPELILGLEMAKWKAFMNILQMVILLHILIHKYRKLTNKSKIYNNSHPHTQRNRSKPLMRYFLCNLTRKETQHIVYFFS